mmetsp:Transcript_39518/g.77769  ORF Transcript_39518/g.77769 Transcript_39518/m.77769 type:complete len:201 (+) Transcript_39518:364-966(+)
MASITIFFACLSMAVSPLRQTTCSWGTTLTVASRVWRPSAFCWLIRSSIQRTSSSSEGTTSALPSTESTDFMMSVRGAITSSCGRPSLIASTASPLLQSLTRRSSACTEASPPSSTTSTKSEESSDQQTFPIPDFCAIFCGQTPRRKTTTRDGQRTTEACRSFSGPTWSISFCGNTTWTSSAERIRWWRMDTNSSQRDNW